MGVDVKGGIKSKVGESKDTNGGEGPVSGQSQWRGDPPSPNGFSLLTFAEGEPSGQVELCVYVQPQ